jgi:hypothetical protein
VSELIGVRFLVGRTPRTFPHRDPRHLGAEIPGLKVET